MASTIQVTAIHGCGTAELRPGARVGPRHLTDWELSLVEAGDGWWDGGGEQIDLHPGTLLLAPPGVRERWRIADEGPLRHLFVHCLASGPMAGLPRSRPAAVPGIAAPLLRHAVDLARRGDPGWHEQACDAIGLLLRAYGAGSLAAPEEPPAPLPPPVVRALEHLRLRWRTGLAPVGVAAMARAAGVGREHLSRCFRDAFGMGPGEAERLLRLDRAVDWLTGSDLSVPDIARRAGWGDPRRFAAALRQGFGRSPRALRSAWRQGQGVRQVALPRLAALRRAAAG